ncbi:hypothetical protein TNCV_2855761, partial [Trichonephila clavipes]
GSNSHVEQAAGGRSGIGIWTVACFVTGRAQIPQRPAGRAAMHVKSVES